MLNGTSSSVRFFSGGGFKLSALAPVSVSCVFVCLSVCTLKFVLLRLHVTFPRQCL